jgi:hypothetical protein
VVLPEQDAVVAITANCKDMQAELNVVWDKLLPALQKTPLAANAEEQGKLKQTLANLAVRPEHVDQVLNPPGSPGRDAKPATPAAAPAPSPQAR